MSKYIGGLFLALSLVFTLSSCSSAKKGVAISDEEQQVFKETEADTVKIADAESEYEIYIIEPGFYTWLKSIARPEGYYSQHFLENRNLILVMEWNRRVIIPTDYDPQLYLWEINYDPSIDYGYDVNYKLYNYFIYFQRKYGQQLGPFQPRI